MEENKEFEVQNQFEGAQLPATVNIDAKDFLTQKIYLTPEQQAKLQAVSDFWHHEIDEEKVNDFLFQKMDI